VFGGGGLTNEKAYQLGKFARVALRTRHIDYNGRFCMSSAAAAGNRAFGLDRGLPFPLEDLGGAGAVLLLGSNVADTMPPFVQHLAGVRDRGGLVVVDPRRSATATLTGDGAGRHLQPLPGTDQVLLLGLLHVLVADDLTDRDYLDTRTEGWEAVRRGVAEWWPGRVADVTGVPESHLRDAARILAGAAPAHGGPGAYVLTGRGVEQHVDGTDTVTAAINLALALGLPGRTGSGYGCLTGQGNGQGGREHGQKSDQLPGYRSITDPAAFPARACRRPRCCAASATTATSRPCSCTAATSSSAHPTRPPYAAGCSRSTCWSCATSCPARPRRSPTSCCRSRSGPRRTAR
jgi:assimilatory nitrate reductase catalytic subunit